MLFPNDPAFVIASQVVGAANYYTHLKSNSRVHIARQNPFFSSTAFAKTLLTYPAVGPLKENWSMAAEYDVGDIIHIIEFFLNCPIEAKPSLLKALYFIDRGGFVPDVSGLSEGDRRGRSPTTLKTNWVRQRERGPFLWAAAVSKYDFLFDISPEERSSIRKIERFLSRPNAVHEYFGIARFCQERLYDRLDSRSKSHFRFIKFPATVASVEMELQGFNPAQMNLLRQYRAPKLI
jgi:hypothetical protein